MQIKALCNRASYALYNVTSKGQRIVEGRFPTKTLLIMKMLFILLTGALLQVQARGKAQTITLTVRDMPLSTVFAEIEKQTGFLVVSKYQLLEMARPVTVTAKNQELNDFMQTILSGQPFDFSIKGRNIFIKEKISGATADLNSKTGVLPPPGTVKGRVTNERGEPMAGANITVQGTNLGTKADDNGHYEISTISPGKHTLVASYVGYGTKTATINVMENMLAELNFTLEVKIAGFDDMIVSANLVASKKREISSAVTVITSKQIEQLPISNIAELFRGEVPGSISWNAGPCNIFNSIKLRGDIDFFSASSTVKIFIDGIEIANTSRISTLPLSAIDHIEVLHGPQASTLYGSGATSGVVYIFTKKGKMGGPHINAKLSAGTIASKYVDKTAYQQDHSLNISGGNEGISYNFGGSYFHYDPYWPDGNNTNTSAFGSVKAKQGNFTTELVGQYSSRKNSLSLNPILKDSFPTIPDFTKPYNTNSTQTEQTLGLNMLYTPFSWWQHNLSLGIDQNNISNIRTIPRNTAFYDSLNYKQNLDYRRKSYRYYTTLRIPLGNFFKPAITAGFDHYVYEFSFLHIMGTGTDPSFTPVGTASSSLQKYSNTGYYAQGVFGFADKFFLTAGIRSESTKQFGNNSGASVAPKVGASFVFDLGNVRIKPRAGYGKSINVPDPSQLVETINSYEAGITFHQLANPGLKPQEQTGYDMGVDIEFGKGLGTLEATYYNQSVNNFITAIFDYSNFPPTIEYQYVNVGKIKNSGLELAGTLNLKPVEFRFTYAITNSKVADISNTGYESLYHNGDQIRGIPKSSGGATITYNFPSLSKSSSNPGGSINLGATYFGDWVNGDIISQNRDYNINFDYSKSQRDYAINYAGYALFRLGLNYNITRNFEAFLKISNLFNSQKFESDNTIPTQGRVTMLGIRINY